MGPEDPPPAGDWESQRAARNRFVARVRPEAMDDPPPSICPDAPLEEWGADEEERDLEGAGS